MKRLNLDAWVTIFKPIKTNPQATGIDRFTFETYGSDHRTVELAPPNLVWTLLEVDGKRYIANGYHYINREGYFITTTPCTKDTEVTLQ